jgi:hypothetical protein
MENTLLAGPPAAGSLERRPFKAWTMKARPAPGEATKEHVSAEPLDEIDRDHKPTLVHGFTLRVKPDRRRVQLPIPLGLDRRRPRS